MAETLETQRESHETVRTGSGLRTLAKWAVALVILGALATGVYTVWERLSRVESTDDAQIDGTIAPVSPRLAGSVTEVLVQDEQPVKAGQVLVQLDKRDYEVALARAKADLADAEAAVVAARSDVPVTSASTSSNLDSARSSRQDAAVAVSLAEQQLGAAKARLSVARANVRVAEANQTKAAQDVARYKELVSKDEFPRLIYDQAVATVAAASATVAAQKAAVTEAEQNVSAAGNAVDQAKARLAQAEAGVQGAMTGPQQVKSMEARVQSALARVAQKKADVQQAELNLSYTTITAPYTGIVGRKAVEVGQSVAPGQQLMAIVDLDDIWVTANFKETQLKDMKTGQRVTFDVDATGRTYTGRVDHIAGASGAKFSLLPPENATGNFVKVVQRIPVRISIDPGQDRDHLLRPGMSATPKVQIR
jgi:membrane fusion protein (multidrug efflux system)